MPRNRTTRIVTVALTLALGSPAWAVDFARQVQPVFARACLRCHGPDRQNGGLRLDRRDSAFRGGESGLPAVAPGDPLASALIERVKSADESNRMPPKGDRLTAAEIETLRQWIAAGAAWPESKGSDTKPGKPAEMVVNESDRAHWAFRPLQKIEVPAGPSPIDAFLTTALAAKGLHLAPEANRRVLARRLGFDLIGLPPDPEDVDAFVNDNSPAASSRLIDRYLADPRYGERWGRHWLDLARYADSEGYERDDDRPGAYHYRDFVIRAFNADLPFDQFLRLQLAGDETPSRENLAATGFLAAGPVVLTDTRLEEELRRYRYDELDDIVTTTGAAMLGLTLGCARCHDHKYDPIPTRDYYRVLTAFASTARTPKNQPLAVVERSSEPAPSWLLDRGDPMSRREPVRFGLLNVLLRKKTPDDYLAAARQSHDGQTLPTTLQRSALALWMTDVDQGAGALAARVMVNRIWRHHFGEGLVRTPSDFGLRGDAPSHPDLLEWLAGRFIADGWSVKKLHRLILETSAYKQGVLHDPRAARIDPENRLLWHRRPLRLEAEALRDAILAVSGTLNPAMFGPGIKPPVPLASTLAAYNTRDPYPRDARDDASTRRRSVYLFTKRSLRNPFLEVFDGADPSASCGRRTPTTVAPQALALLNDDLVRRRARDLADRLIGEGGEDSVLIRRAFALALGRPPRPAEIDASSRFLKDRTASRKERGKASDEARRLALADFGQALFSLNEFLYVE